MKNLSYLLKHLTFWEYLLVVVILIHVIANIWWISTNNAPLPWDPANHTHISMNIAQKISQFDLLGIITVSNYYPIVVHTIAGLVLAFIGSHLKVIQTIDTLFFAATLIALYLYAKALYNNKWIGFFAAALFSFFPIAYNQSRWLMLDIPSVALLLVSSYFLEKSHHLTHKKNTLLFFTTAGLLMMTKVTGILYILAPLLFHGIKLFYSKKHTKSTFHHIGLGLGIFALIVLPWYLTNLQSLLFFLKINSTGEMGEDPNNLLSLENIFRYLQYFVNTQVTPLIAGVFFIASGYLLYRRIKHAVYLLGIIGVNYVIFTFIGNKDPRYTLPMLPYVALVIALSLDHLRKKYHRVGTAVSTGLVLMLALYFVVLTVRPALFEGTQVFLKFPLIGRIEFINVTNSLVKKYDTNQWPVNDILDDIATLSHHDSTSAIVGVEYEHFNPSTLQTYLKTKQQHDTSLTLTSPHIAFLILNYGMAGFPSNTEVKNYLEQSQYILTSPNALGPRYLRNKKALEQLQFYVFNDTFLPCDDFLKWVSPPKTTCIVKIGETLYTTSDVSINNSPAEKGFKTIPEFSKVYCQWGCSFIQINSPQESALSIKLIKTYVLPDTNQVNLYKIY